MHGINAIRLDGGPSDDHYHGTHVASTVGTVGDNGIGVTGVAWVVPSSGPHVLTLVGPPAIPFAPAEFSAARSGPSRIILR